MDVAAVSMRIMSAINNQKTSKNGPRAREKFRALAESLRQHLYNAGLHLQASR